MWRRENMCKQKKGQALLEFTVSIGTGFLLFFLVLQLIFVSGAKMYIHHYLYRALFCMAQGNASAQCRQNMIQQIKKFVVWGNFEKVLLTGTSNRWKGDVIWTLKPWKIKLIRTLKIPEDLL